jgi:hypothetical protein
MECMDIFNISDAEIEPLRNGSFNARTLTLKLKVRHRVQVVPTLIASCVQCFIKCIGDLTGLV